MKKPLISIIVPIYNSKDTVDVCLNSILDQTEKNFEVIVVDDGSSDGVWKLLEKYAARDKRIKIFHQENMGVSVARNYGLKMSEGDYISFVDADDYIEKNYLCELYQVICEFHSDISYCCNITEAPDGKPLKKNRRMETVPISFSVEDSYSYTSNNYKDAVWAALYRKEILKGIFFPEDLYIGEDAVFFAKAAKRSRRIVRIDKELYHYVVSSSSAYHRDFSEKKYTELEAWDRICKIFIDYPKIYCSAKCNYACCCHGMIRRYYKSSDFKKGYYSYVLKQYRKNLKWFYRSKEVSFIRKMLHSFCAMFPWIVIFDQNRY